MQDIPVYDSALGISVGDLVRTSYGTGPSEVERINGPVFYDEALPSVLIVRTWPVVYVGFSGSAGIGSIRQDGTRWFTDDNAEIFVAKSNASRKPSQFQMFASSGQTRHEPYPFKQGVDYEHNVWRCRHCGDFNAAPNDERLRLRWHCPLCGKSYAVDYKILLMTPRVVGKSQMNDYITALSSLSFREQSEIESIGGNNIHVALDIWFKQQKNDFSQAAKTPIPGLRKVSKACENPAGRHKKGPKTGFSQAKTRVGLSLFANQVEDT